MSSATTLLVEDNEEDIFFMTQALEKAGVDCQVRVVRDGQAALDYLDGTGEFADRGQLPLPDLILLDLKLPLIPGFEVLKWVRQQPRLNKVVVIVLTSSREPVDHNQAYRLGANSIMEKPPTAEKVIDLVQFFRLWGHGRGKAD